MKTIKAIEVVKDPKHSFSLPLQYTIVENYRELKKNLPKVKIIEVESLSTPAFPVILFYKPISRVI